jgi:pectin methylesterase-like acyl-CoA thioesterase
VPAPTLQWQTNHVNVTDGSDANGSIIAGSTASTLYITNAQVADSVTYSLIASNSAGMVTNSMNLTVAAGSQLPVITGPTNITVIQGNNGTFSASASGVPVPTLQWLDQTQTPISDATNATLTLSNVLYSQNGFVYSIVASNSVGSVTNGATLTVIVPPAITNQPVSLVVTNTQSASFTVGATGVPAPTFQWNKNGTPISSLVNNTATNATFSIASVSPSDTASYSVTISNPAGSTNSATVTLTVNSTMSPIAFSPTNGATGICYDTPLYLTFSSAPTLRASGAVKIFNTTNSATPVDTINLSLNVTNNASAQNVQSRTIGGDSFTNYPVIITGNTAAIYPHLGVLTSNQTYYVTLDNGTFADTAGANFAGITATNIWKFSTKPGGAANVTNILVAADGTGDFVTVQGAVDSVPSGNTPPTLITINSGNYVEIVNIKTKHNLTLRGQSRSGTVIGYANNANLQGSTHARMAMKINANDIALDNLTVTNRTPVGGSQAEALMLESGVKRFIFNNCNLGSYQDTLLANGSTGAQAYFNNSLVTGQFDYIWGGGDCFFTNCEIRTLTGTGGSGSGNLTASRTDNQAAGNWAGYNGLSSSNGFSFVNCRLTGATGVTNVTLAGSNGTSNGVAAWIDCLIDTNVYKTPSVAVLNSQLLWEYGNSNLLGTAPATFGVTLLTSSDARCLAAASAVNWLNGWVPQLAPNILTNPVSQTVNYASPAAFTVAATGIPDPTYQWQHAGTNLPSATGATLTIASATSSDAGSYAVIVTTPAGSATSSSATLTVNPPPNTAPTFTAPITGTNITINVGVSLSVACTATDSDIPPQTLTYSLLSGPTNSAVDSGTGNFTWRPNVPQSNSVNSVSVVVTDNGTPNLSATNSFTVTVNALTAPVTGASDYTGGLFSVTVGGQTGPDYALQATTNLVGGTWTTVATTNSPATMPVILTDPNAGSQPMQFYRIVTGPPLP